MKRKTNAIKIAEPQDVRGTWAWGISAQLQDFMSSEGEYYCSESESKLLYAADEILRRISKREALGRDAIVDLVDKAVRKTEEA